MRKSGFYWIQHSKKTQVAFYDSSTERWHLDESDDVYSESDLQGVGKVKLTVSDTTLKFWGLYKYKNLIG